MPSFKYKALDRTGRIIKHSLEAASMESAKSSLRQMGCTILEFYESNAMNRDIELPFFGNPKAKDMAVFCRQFGSILRAGVSVAQVLRLLGQQTLNKKLVAAIHQMQVDIEKGDTLSDAMSRHGRIFPTVMVNVVAAGESSGNLGEAFQQMEVYFDKVKRTKSAVSKAMTYPMVLVTTMIIVTFVMMTEIIPSFIETFADVDMELPAVTRSVVAASDFFVKWWWLMSAACVCIAVFVLIFRRTDKGRHIFGWFSRKLPVLGGLTVRSAGAAFCRMLSMLLASGLNLTDSLELVANSMANVYFKEATRNIASRVAQGWQLNVAIQETGLFPPMLDNLVAVGEETGDIQGMLDKTADYYDEEVEAATQKLLGLMEPAMLLFLAVFVVIIVLAIFLPTVSMTEAYGSYL